jgi:hypothetical protein
MNTDDFERKWVANEHGKDGRVMRIVVRGSDRTITGNEVLLTSDQEFQQPQMREILADLALGRPATYYQVKTDDPNVAEALRRWADGARVLNGHHFAVHGKGDDRQVVYRGTERQIDGVHVRLNCDNAYPETNVRYFLADMMLGGSREFYWRTAEAAHEMGCLEAVLRYDTGVKITNLDAFERKQVDGKTVITRQGSNYRISGMEVQLWTD